MSFAWVRVVTLAAAAQPTGADAGIVIMAIAGLAVLAIICLVTFLARYKRCPADRLMVITGRLPDGQSCKVVREGAAFVWPLIQQVDYLSLEPQEVRVELGPTRLRDGEDRDPVARLTCAVGTEPERMAAAARRLLGMDPDAVGDLAEDLARGALRFELAGIASAQLHGDRQTVLDRLREALDAKLAEVGLEVIAFELA